MSYATMGLVALALFYGVLFGLTVVEHWLMASFYLLSAFIFGAASLVTGRLR